MGCNIMKSPWWSYKRVIHHPIRKPLFNDWTMAISQKNLMAWPVCFQTSISFINVHINVCLL